jgi:hypothetical protein
MSYIYYNALHEAGHVILALCARLDVAGFLVKTGGICTARTIFDPTKASPLVVYGFKIAGSIAVDIQNQNYGTSDDNGLGEPDNPLSDAATIEKLRQYLSSAGLSPEVLAAHDADVRKMVRQTLINNWNAVEALAQEIVNGIATDGSVDAVKMGKALRVATPEFYERIKGNLVTVSLTS